MTRVSDIPQRKPIVTRLRYGRLSAVFPTQRNKLLHQQIARLCVLFEDLRIEVSGMAAEDLGRLDEVDPKLRGLYFLRRSVGTLHEFTEALREIDQSVEFTEIRERLKSIGAIQHWVRATM
jgi:hypothetical protein